MKLTLHVYMTYNYSYAQVSFLMRRYTGVYLLNLLWITMNIIFKWSSHSNEAHIIPEWIFNTGISSNMNMKSIDYDNFTPLLIFCAILLFGKSPKKSTYTYSFLVILTWSAASKCIYELAFPVISYWNPPFGLFIGILTSCTGCF